MVKQLKKICTTRKRKTNYGKTIAVAAVVMALSACASGPKHKDIPSLKPELSRVVFQPSNRVPNLIRERWFGEIVRVRNTNKDIVFSSFTHGKQSEAIRWLDLEPGKYEITAQCQPHAAYRGGLSLALASLDVTLEAGESLKLGCELYRPKPREGSTVKKRSSNKREYSARLVELNSYR